MGKRLKDIYPHATKWQVFKYKVGRFLRKLFWTSAGVCALYLAFQVGVYLHPNMVYAEKEIQVQVDGDFPVLQRIASCESVGNVSKEAKQFDSKGRLIKHANTDGSVDIGKNMINDRTWEAKAVTLGYDIYTEKGNDDMAKWIYKNIGTSPWSASMKCWNR